MTVADFIRNMSDLEMAQFLEVIISARDEVMSKKLQDLRCASDLRSRSSQRLFGGLQQQLP